MKILNKLISIVLCLVLLLNVTITVLAEESSNNTKDLITYRVPVISNEYTEKTVVFYEHEGKYYLDIEDIKNFTRSTISETDSKIVITHGIRELEIDKSTGHLIDSTVYDQGIIPFLAYEGKYLCEGIPMLMYLGAACTIRDGVALEVLMPSITIWESIMPDYLDYYFNITELYGGEDNVKISLICDILSDVLDGVSGHGLFADGDTHLEDALFEILEVDMMKYASVQEAVATKNQDINDFLSSDAVGTLLEGGSNTTDTVSEVLDYYADFYLETEILKNNIRWQHSYNIGDIDFASKLSKQINSQVYEQSSIKANLGTYENLADVLDLGMIAFDTAVTSYGLMQYDNDTKSLFARTINDEMFNYVGYNEISWTNVSNRISNKLSSNEAIVASTAVENLTEYVAGELAEGGTVQALSAFTSKANIYVAAAQIATFVSSLINRDLHEAYSADMNAIWLSAVQYDIARLTTQVLLKAGEEEKFSNVESIEKLKDMLTLYYRTTIAFSENIAVSIDEFGNKNKDEWVKYFSSTTDSSVANYAAQYLYRITNCTIVPIVEYSTLSDNLLNSDVLSKTIQKEKGITFVDNDDFDIPYVYRDVIEKYIASFPWNNSDTVVSGLEGVSYLYRYYDSLSEIGYAFADVDNNGKVEMLFGAVGVESRSVFDMYTLSDDDAIHLFDGGERFRYSLRTDGSIINDWSSSAYTSGLDKYILNDSGNGLEFQQRVVYDGWYALEQGLIDDINGENIADKCYFFSESEKAQSGYVNISADKAKELRDNINDEKTYVNIDYTPLSEYRYDTENLEDWKNLYIKVINDNSQTYRYYSLMYIDSDDIPELYIHAGATPGDIVYSVKDNSLIQVTCCSGVLYYIEKEGVFCVDGRTNVNINQTERPKVDYYKLNDGEFVAINENDFDWNKTTYTDAFPLEGAIDDIVNW